MGKYKREALTLLDKKNENGLFVNKEDVRTVEVLDLGGGVSIKHAFKDNKRKPFALVAGYSGANVSIISLPHYRSDDPIECMLQTFGGIEATRQSIIDRFKELKLV